MATNDKPKARQSQLVTTYGVGSLFPAGDKSYMICGTDDWDERFSPIVEEPRLARSLGVQHFRAPSTGRRAGDVPVVRFPTYHYCPQCRRLDAFWKFDRVKMQCQDCIRDLTPSRFVACCEDGHIEDFPYFQWIHRGAEFTTGAEHKLFLESRGASSSLADIVIKCSCDVRPINLDGSFGRFALRDVKRCGGQRPWLPDSVDETCDKTLRVLQRGSSNVWFSAVRSSISIPPWSNPSAKFVTKFWPLLQAIPPEALAASLENLLANNKEGVTAKGVSDAMALRQGLESSRVPTEDELRDEEYVALTEGNDGGNLDTFQCREVEVDERVSPLVAQVSMVSRLREVRALHGFTRVTASPTDSSSPRLAKLSTKPMQWLPATEVLGEGIFLRLEEGVVAEWEASVPAIKRLGLLTTSIAGRDHQSQDSPIGPPSTRFVALHSLAHVILKELSLDAGYPVGSLRERVYAGAGQAGILIYTASSDAAGSLGGLAALAAPGKFAKALLSALSRASWCSNDPVCAESGASGSDGLNLAACHACLLLPETSCEERNVFLDRVIVVGDPDAASGGLASDLVTVP